MAEAVRHGLRNAEIARRMSVTPDAVKFHVSNILAKLGLESRAALRRWDGVNRDSRLKGGTRPMTDHPIALGALGQISRTVRDVAAARRWYEEVLGLAHVYSFGDLAFFDCGGTRLFLSQDAGAGSQSILYFEVEDIHAAHAALTTRGVTFVSAPHMIHRHDDGVEEWMAFFNDPEGRPLALMTRTGI